MGLDLCDEYGRLLQNGALKPLQTHFESRVTALSNDSVAAAQEIFTLKWGPTQLPIFNVILMYIYLLPSSQTYPAMAEYLVNTAKVPVDGTDVSGTTAMMHAISTKPYFNTSFAQMMYDAGGQINHRSRYGGTAAHEFVKVYSFDIGTKRRAADALQWFMAHGGDIDIKDGDGISSRYLISRLASRVPEYASVLRGEGQEKEKTLKEKKVGRNDPCTCGSQKKFKVCCGKN